MIFPPGSAAHTPVEHTVTMADGQTFELLVVKPNYQQRFNDEGRELHAHAGTANDAWSNYRLGRIRDAVVDWKDVTNEKGQPVPYTFNRLMSLFEAAPEVIRQVVAIANEAFRPLDLPSLKSDDPPANSGAADASVTSELAQNSDSTANSDGSGTSPEPPESPSAS